MEASHLPAVYACLSHQQSSPPACSCGPRPPPGFSKSPVEPWPPATASPSNTHFALPVPHMNNTWSDSLCWVNESIGSRASETLMASQRRPLAGALLATRCPQCRVMNIGIPFSALCCRSLKAIAHGFSAARLIFKHMHRRAPQLWCNQSAPEQADEATSANTLMKADWTGAFLHVWINTRLNMWLRRCSFPSCLFPSITVGVTHAQRGQVTVATWYAGLPCAEWGETLTRKWPPAVTVHLSTALMNLFFLFYKAIFTWHRWVWHNAFLPQKCH